MVHGMPAVAYDVRKRFERLRPLERQRWYNRGWTMDVLKVVRALEKKEFSLAEIYSSAGQLRRLHPENRHVEPKIRQQLQRLRDLGFLEFLGRGRYRVKQ